MKVETVANETLYMCSALKFTNTKRGMAFMFICSSHLHSLSEAIPVAKPLILTWEGLVIIFRANICFVFYDCLTAFNHSEDTFSILFTPLNQQGSFGGHTINTVVIKTQKAFNEHIYHY